MITSYLLQRYLCRQQGTVKTPSILSASLVVCIYDLLDSHSHKSQNLDISIWLKCSQPNL